MPQHRVVPQNRMVGLAQILHAQQGEENKARSRDPHPSGPDKSCDNADKGQKANQRQSGVTHHGFDCVHMACSSKDCHDVTRTVGHL